MSAALFEKGAEVQRIPADTVILAVGSRANAVLAEQLKATGQAAHVIGDAIEARKLADAIREGFLLGNEL